MLDVRRLSYFVAVAETLHFGKAAERLRIAQPALSQQIRRLEEELGCQLLRRDRRRVELTAAGLALLDTGRRALVQMARAGEAARRTAASHAALLRIGFLSPAAFAVVPDVLRRLRLAHPAVYLVLREGDSVTLLEEVRLGLLDIAFVRGPITWPAVRIDTLRREPLVLSRCHHEHVSGGGLPADVRHRSERVVHHRQSRGRGYGPGDPAGIDSDVSTAGRGLPFYCGSARACGARGRSSPRTSIGCAQRVSSDRHQGHGRAAEVARRQESTGRCAALGATEMPIAGRSCRIRGR